MANPSLKELHDAKQVLADKDQNTKELKAHELVKQVDLLAQTRTMRPAPNANLDGLGIDAKNPGSNMAPSPELKKTFAHLQTRYEAKPMLEAKLVADAEIQEREAKTPFKTVPTPFSD
jgi:hypothetical protein